MAKSKKVRMPIGMRNKLMAAVSMLLVSSIMMVSTTFAWFTLSTAPEVTGITTSVGANGNLEIALLNTTTFANTSSISSAVGDSSAAAGKTVPQANITWGNLVDLSDASYGLTGISLLPAAVKGTYNTTGDGENQVKTLATVDPACFLNTPTYGADGRVVDTDGTTVSAIYNATNGTFPYEAGTQTYGVRAIGATSSMSARQIAFGSAKTNANSALTTAKAGTKSAISNNMSALMAFAGADSAPTTYTAKQLASFRAIAAGIVNDIKALETGYKNALIAVVATTAADDTEFTTLKAGIEDDDLAALATAATDANRIDMASGINSLKTAQDNAKSAQTTLNEATADDAASGTDVTAAIKLLIGESPTKDTSNDSLKVYITTGAVGELANQLGQFELASVSGIGAAYAGAAGVHASGTYTAVVGTVNGLVAPDGTDTANISDTYGYVIDFAFRTNASGANLQLQTAAMNRVYSDQTDSNLATQGSGSTVTFTYTNGLTFAQAQKLLGAIKLVFLNPETGAVYATAGLTEIVDQTTSATAKVKLDDQTGDADAIVALAQNTATRVSVLVYMDGNTVDNTAVINAASSGSLKLNLQFSSSEALTPMKNTALQTMTKDSTPAVTGSISATGDGNVTVGSDISLTAILSGADIDSVVWESDNDGIATVSSSGSGSNAVAIVHGVSDGDAKITATITYNGDQTVQANYTVHVES